MIRCANIVKIYDNGGSETVALKGVSVEIKKGEFVAVMGPSGSGKSTLMHILGALDTPTEGTYFLDGKDVSRMSDDELAEVRKRKIGFIFQAFNLLPRTTVFRNVLLPLIYLEMPRKEREGRAEKVLEAVGISKDLWNHLSNELSGGQIQRVAIARALVNNPSLILADEPTGNLDTKTGQRILGILEELNQKENRTIILITHEEEVAKYASRIIMVRDGQIVKDIKK